MANKLRLSTLLLAVGLCSCSKERTVSLDNHLPAAESVSNTNRVNKTEFNEMVGKQVRLAGALISTGKGNYALQTTNGLVALDGYLDVKETHGATNVLIEGVLDFQKVVAIPKDFDPLSVQSTARPGQDIPEHFLLRHPKIVRSN
jgi:hypothetical protein